MAMLRLRLEEGATAAPRAGAAPPPAGALLRRLRYLLSVRAERRRLAELDDRALRDIGLSRAEALREAQRPLWDLPPLAARDRGPAPGC